MGKVEVDAGVFRKFDEGLANPGGREADQRRIDVETLAEKTPEKSPAEHEVLAVVVETEALGPGLFVFGEHLEQLRLGNGCDVRVSMDEGDSLSG